MEDKNRKRVLFCTDLGEGCDPAFEHALEVAENEGAALDILHVRPVNANHGMAEAYLRRSEESALREAFTVQLNRLYEDRYMHRKGPRRVPISTITKSGTPDEEIVKCADENKPSLIVMGGSAGWSLTRAIMGDIPGKVMRASHIPVLVIPSK